MAYKPWYDVIDSEIARMATPKTYDKTCKLEISFNFEDQVNLELTRLIEFKTNKNVFRHVPEIKLPQKHSIPFRCAILL